MKDEEKTKEQLINELVEAHQRIAELEAGETERKRAEESLREAHLLLEKTFSSLNEAVFVVDPDTRAIIACNQAVELIFGYGEDEVVGRNTEFMHVDRAMYEKFGRELFPALDADGVFHAEHQCRRKNGSIFFTEHTVTEIVNDSGHRTSLVSIVRDITERRQAEEAVRESEARLAGILEIAEDAIISVGTDQRITLFNKGAEKIFGYTVEETLGQPLDILLPERFAQSHRDHVQDFAASPVPSQVMSERETLSGLRKDGTEFPVEISISKLKLGGEIVFTAILRDVTERKRAEEEIRKHRDRLEELVAERTAELDKTTGRLESLIESSSDAIIVTDRDGEVILFNKGAEDLSGYRREEAIGRRTPLLYASEEDAKEVMRLMREGDGTVSAFETTFRAKDGSLIPVLISASLLYDEEGREAGTVGISKDLRERKRTEDELRLLQTTTLAVSEAEDFYSALDDVLRLVCETTDWVLGEAWVPSVDGTRLKCSPAWHCGTGGLEAFRAGSKWVTFEPGEGLPGRAWSSREPVWVADVTSPDFAFKRREVALEAGFKAGMAVPITTGDEVVAVMNFFVFEPREEDERLLGLVSTVAAQLGAVMQRKRAEEALIQSEKMASLGRLTAGVSHEVLNPLNIISVSHQLMLDDPATPQAIAQQLDILQGQVHRITKITQDLLSFSRRREPERSTVDVNEVVTQTLGLIESGLRLDNIEVEMRLAEDLPPISADHGQLQQMVLNLLTNARDVMPNGGRLSIRTGTVLNYGRRFVELQVEDTGDGIAPEHMDKLFEPFFTTKPEGEGTGLGLSICQGIIEAHEGVISAENVPDGGAVFIVHLNVEGEHAKQDLGG